MDTKQKHKILLSNLKKYYKEDDDIGDKELINKLITEYLVIEEKNGNLRIKKDNYSKSKYNLITRTKQFGGWTKHLDSTIAIPFAKQLYNLS